MYQGFRIGSLGLTLRLFSGFLFIMGSAGVRKDVSGLDSHMEIEHPDQVMLGSSGGGSQHYLYPETGYHTQRYIHSSRAGGAGAIQADQFPRPTRQLGPMGGGNLQVAASSGYGYGSTGQEFGGYAAAGHHYGGHGHKGDNVNTSAVGLLGFLALLSLIQSVLRQLTTTGMGRRRRGLDGDENETELSTDIDFEESKITRMLLPLFNAVAHAGDGRVPFYCTELEICRANKMLVKEIGDRGRNVGIVMSKALGNMFKEMEKKMEKKKEGMIKTMVDKAARNGRDGINCEKIYKECPLLKRVQHIFIPTITSIKM